MTTGPQGPLPARSPTEERRRTHRVPLEAIVHYQMQGAEFINLSSNISAEGIFIKNFDPPPVGTQLRIKVQLPGDMGGLQVNLMGTVVRVATDSDHEERGMGVSFDSVEASDPEAIRFFVTEVYEVENLERLETEPPAGGSQQPGYRYEPDPDDVLRLQADNGDARKVRDGQTRLFYDPHLRWVWAGLLILVGALLGAGLVLVFLLDQ